MTRMLVLGLYYSLSLLLLLGARGVEEVGRGLLDVVAGLGRLCGNSCRGDDAAVQASRRCRGGRRDDFRTDPDVVRRELGEEPFPERARSRPELARVRDHLCIKFRAPHTIDATLSP